MRFRNLKNLLKKMLSKYELERNANIRRNQAMLEALGLGGSNALKQKAPVVPRLPAPIIPEEDRRRSSRVSKQVVTLHALDYEFFDEEERRAEGRGRSMMAQRSPGSRKRTAPPSFQEEQAHEVAVREDKAARRREQTERANMVMMAQAVRPQQAQRVVVQAAPLASDLPVITDDDVCRPAHQFAYPTLSKRARCPHCSGIFVITSKGVLHKHDCRPAAFGAAM